MTTPNSQNLQQIGSLSSQQPFTDKNGHLTRQGYLLLNALSTQAVPILSTASSATSGSASALPAAPAGYLEIPLNGVVVKVAYYN